jgi:hypothetical protein
MLAFAEDIGTFPNGNLSDPHFSFALKAFKAQSEQAISAYAQGPRAEGFATPSSRPRVASIPQLALNWAYGSYLSVRGANGLTALKSKSK